MKKDKKNAMINKILIWNLSASDFLVGVYTMTICVKSVTMQGKYCKEDVEWRSGITCSAIGALLMIGTESSVFTLTIITGFRVYTLLRPFVEVRLRTIRHIIVLSWTLAIAIAVIPLLPVTEDYFVDNVWLSQNPFFSIINKNEIKGLNQWISTIQTENNDTLTLSDSWSALETMLKRLNPKFNIDQKFGYYSTHTVCLPTVFPNPMKDMAWGYSLIFLIFNFLAFFVISVGYFVIYKNSTRENKALTNQQLKERAKSMQKKVTVIIITDLLCWMPICIMGFLQVAGIDIPNDAYLPVGLIIIPINSMINPMLYYALPKPIKYILAWFRKRVHAKNKHAAETPQKKIDKNGEQHEN
uniref:relaxin receptor 1-like isoform X2 n=1 Tax=Styela clava TaxID=7725 RepID=UPI00193A1975|nr:relaxin receptor 1-like isoform X2 [Styela clava]